MLTYISCDIVQFTRCANKLVSPPSKLRLCLIQVNEVLANKQSQAIRVDSYFKQQFAFCLRYILYINTVLVLHVYLNKYAVHTFEEASARGDPRAIELLSPGHVSTAAYTAGEASSSRSSCSSSSIADNLALCWLQFPARVYLCASAVNKVSGHNS